jgi:hypothetical protein
MLWHSLIRFWEYIRDLFLKVLLLYHLHSSDLTKAISSSAALRDVVEQIWKNTQLPPVHLHELITCTWHKTRCTATLTPIHSVTYSLTEPTVANKQDWYYSTTKTTNSKKCTVTNAVIYEHQHCRANIIHTIPDWAAHCSGSPVIISSLNHAFIHLLLLGLKYSSKHMNSEMGTR